MNELQPILPDEVIISKIYLFRGQKVMLDSDLAELYEVETKALKQAVKRNIDIFPSHFFFELNQNEFKSLIDNVRSQTVTSQLKSTTYAPYVFSEYGVLQLAHVLRSSRAKKMSIRIIEVFVRMREMLLTHKDILQKLEQLEKNDNEQNKSIKLIFEYLKQFEKAKQVELEQRNRPLIGFKNKQ